MQTGRGWREQKRADRDGKHKQTLTYDSSIIAIIIEQYAEGHYQAQSRKAEQWLESEQPQVCAAASGAGWGWGGAQASSLGTGGGGGAAENMFCFMIL